MRSGYYAWQAFLLLTHAVCYFFPLMTFLTVFIFLPFTSPMHSCKCNIILVLFPFISTLSQTNVAIKTFSLKFPCHALSSLSKFTPPSSSVSICGPAGFMEKRWFPVAMAASFVCNVVSQVAGATPWEVSTLDSGESCSLLVALNFRN